MKQNESKKSKNKSNVIAPGFTVYPNYTSKATDMEEYQSEMAIIGNLILSNYAGRSFSIRDFVALSRSLDVPFLSVKKYYESFVKEQLADKRIVEISTIMDDKTFVVI